VDVLLKLVDPKKAIRELDLQYHGRHTDKTNPTPPEDNRLRYGVSQPEQVVAQLRCSNSRNSIRVEATGEGYFP
jgi:hypothetical protein